MGWVRLRWGEMRLRRRAALRWGGLRWGKVAAAPGRSFPSSPARNFPSSPARSFPHPPPPHPSSPARLLPPCHCSYNVAELVGDYGRWSAALEKGTTSIAVLYASDYGFSDRLSQTLARGITKVCECAH